MTVETRNQILSVVLGIIILLLCWWLYDSIVTPYQKVKQQEAMIERVRTNMITLKDALVQYEANYGHFPPNEGGLDSVVQFLKTDSLMVAKGDTLFRQMAPSVYHPDSMIVSPRSGQRFAYTYNDTTRPPLYLLEDPDSDDTIGSLNRTTMRNAPNWN